MRSASFERGHLRSNVVTGGRLRSYEIGLGHKRTSEATEGLLRSHLDG